MLVTSSTSTSSAATTSSQLGVLPTGLRPVYRDARSRALYPRDARSNSLPGGSASSPNAIPKLTKQFSHVLLPARPKYIPNSAISLPTGPSLTPVEYGGPKMHISSRTVSRGQVHFQLSRVADGATTLYPEDVPLERLFDFITPEELQKFEHEQYAVEEEQEKLRKTVKRRGRPPGSKKKTTVTGPSTQAGSGDLSPRPPSSEPTLSVTSETDPLQRESERDAIERAPPQPSGQGTTSSAASTRSTISQQSEEVEQGRYQMLPPTPRRILQSVTRSSSTSPVPVNTASFAQAQQYVSPAAKNNDSRRPKTVANHPSRSPEHINNETNSHHMSRPTATSRPASVSSSATSKIGHPADSDDEQSVNSEALLRQFQGQSVQRLKHQSPLISLISKHSHTPNSTKTKALISSSSPILPPSASKKRPSPNKPPTPTPRTARKRKRLFTRKPPTPKPAAPEEEDWYIERIVDHRKPSYPSRFHLEYLIKWRDHPADENTWQSEESLVGADEMLKNYRARVAVEGAGEHGRRWVRAMEGRSGGKEEDEDDEEEMSM